MKKRKSKNFTTDELSLFEDAFADYIKCWQESGRDPVKHLERLRGDASELLDVALDSIPCWMKIPLGPYVFKNGLYKTPAGTALVHDGYFVMVEEIVERLPRKIE